MRRLMRCFRWSILKIEKMSEIMRPLPFKDLLMWVREEYKSDDLEIISSEICNSILLNKM